MFVLFCFVFLLSCHQLNKMAEFGFVFILVFAQFLSKRNRMQLFLHDLYRFVCNVCIDFIVMKQKQKSLLIGIITIK